MLTGIIKGLGFVPRLLLSLTLVFATYNPEKPYSYFYWALADLPEFSALKAFAGVVLLIGWSIYLSATIEALGLFGLLLTLAFFGTGLWVLIDQGWIHLDSPRAITYSVLILLSAVLAVGLGWSHTRRRITGQVDVHESPRD